MRLAVDVDDTLAEFHEVFVDFCNLTFGTNLKKEDFTGPNINTTWQVPHEEIMRRANAFDVADAKKAVKPRPGAQQSDRPTYKGRDQGRALRV